MRRIGWAALAAMGMITTAGGGALAQTLVVPGSLANVEGNNGMDAPFTSAPFRQQQVYAGGEFGMTPTTITGLAFRPSESGGAFGPTTFPNMTITLSTTTAMPDMLDTTFANNVGMDVATVFMGDLTLSSAKTGCPPFPCDFDINIPLQNNFAFDPTVMGNNLLLDVTNPTGAISTFIDAEGLAADSISVLQSINPTSVTGTNRTIGLVTQFSVSP